MGKSSAGKEIADAAAKMSLDQLNSKISWAKDGWSRGGSSQAKRAFFKSLVAYETQRELLFGIEAPKRRYNR